MAATPDADFEARVLPHRKELHAYCYRMLGSLQDADDALQDALLGAWRGLGGFEGRSSLRSWLYQVTTHACLRLVARRPQRVAAYDRQQPTEGVELDNRVDEPIWLEPYPTDTGQSFEQLESVELSFVAALQHLPPNQRAALILRDVLSFESSEVAELLETSVASVNSALQRARETVTSRVPPQSQQAALRELGEAGERQLVEAFVAAWRKSDVDGLVQLLRQDVRFSMPPIPSWFDGLAAVTRFFRERVFTQRWRIEPTRANGQLAFALHMSPDFRPSGLNVVTLQAGRIRELTGFLDPALHPHFFPPDR